MQKEKGMHIVRSLKTKIICPNWREEADFYQVHFGMEVAEQWDEPTDKGIILGLGPIKGIPNAARM